MTDETTAAGVPSDATRPDYPQPRCGICGRFAARTSGGSWTFRCVTWTGDGWEHK